MLGREPRPQATDAARADDGDTQFLAFDGGFLPRLILSGAREGKTRGVTSDR
jgi:hypothetical protein